MKTDYAKPIEMNIDLSKPQPTQAVAAAVALVLLSLLPLRPK